MVLSVGHAYGVGYRRIVLGRSGGSVGADARTQNSAPSTHSGRVILPSAWLKNGLSDDSLSEQGVGYR